MVNKNIAPRQSITKVIVDTVDPISDTGDQGPEEVIVDTVDPISDTGDQGPEGLPFVKQNASASNGPSWTVMINVPLLNVRSAPYATADIIGKLGKNETHTIVEEFKSGSSRWGKLESGGWILLVFTTNV